MSYQSRFEEELIKLLAEKIEHESDILVSNRSLSDRDVEYMRGGIAKMREIIRIINKEIPQKLNEA